jgi:outer membrane protein assembly factor BamB
VLKLQRVRAHRFPHKSLWYGAADESGIYVADSGANTYALDPVTFDVRWSVPSKHFQVDFVRDGAVVGQSMRADTVRALDSRTGKVLWTAPTYGLIWEWRGCVFVDSEDPTEYTLYRPSDGTIAEQGHLPPGTILHLADSVVVLEARALRAVAIPSREDLWRCPLPLAGADEGIRTFAIAREEGLLVLPSGKKLHAIDLGTGKTLWTRGKPSDSVWDRGQIHGGHLLVYDSRSLTSLDARTGETEWSQPRSLYGQVAMSYPERYGDSFVLLGTDHVVRVISAADGSVTGTYSAPKSANGLFTCRAHIVLFFASGGVDVVGPPAASGAKEKAAKPSATKKRAQGKVAQGKVAVVHSIRPKGRRVGPWLATDAGLVVTQGHLDDDTLGFRADTYALVVRDGRTWTTRWEIDGHWSPRFTMGDVLVVVDGPGDLVGACSLKTGKLRWATSSPEAAVWRLGDRLVALSPLAAEVQILKPENGKVVARHQLPRPYVEGVFGDVVLVRDAWISDQSRFRKVAKAKRPRGACAGLDLETGKVLWTHETDTWFTATPQSDEVLDHFPDPLAPPADFPPMLLLRSFHAEERRLRRRGVSPRDLSELWTTGDSHGFEWEWVPELASLVFWNSGMLATTSGVDLLDAKRGRYTRLCETPPRTKGRATHEVWQQYLGLSGRSLVFQNAQRCIDLLDLDRGESSHHELAKPTEYDGGGPFGDLFVLYSRDQALDLVEIP